MDNPFEEIKKMFPDEEIQFVTTPHQRTEKLESDWKPSNEKEFYEVIQLPFSEIKKFGFRKWDTFNNTVAENVKNEDKAKMIVILIINQPGETLLYDLQKEGVPKGKLETDMDIILFPGEWYDVIPDGFKCVGLWGNEEIFKKGVSDNDIRFGCIPYGILKPIESKDYGTDEKNG